MFYKKQLKQLRDNASPSPEFKSELRAKLNQETYMTNQSWMRRFAPAALAAIVVFFALGTGAYAYESPSVTEGHPLHFLKNNFERWEGRFADNPEKQAMFHAKMMDRRMGEAEHLGWGSEGAQAMLDAAAEEMGLTVDELREDMRDPETRMEIMDQLAEQGFEFAKACQRHNEMYGQGKAKGFGIGQHLMNPEDLPEGEFPPPPHMRRGPGMGEDVQTLRDDIFSNAELSTDEKREAFHEGMMQLMADRIGQRPDQADDDSDNEEEDED